MNVLIYSERPSVRLSYVVDILFDRLLGTPARLTYDRSEYLAYAGPRCNYSRAAVARDELHLYPHNLLFETGVREQPLSTLPVDGVPAIFGVPPGYALPFDPAAAAFFMLSRYEEYLDYTPDAHGRYPATAAWAYRNGCLHYPVVWAWAELLSKALRERFPNWRVRPPGYQWRPTYDVDLPWAYRHRGLRGLGRAVLELARGDRARLAARRRAWRDPATDPYATFVRLRKLHGACGVRPRFFWLLADAGRYDTNPAWTLPAYRELIRATAAWSDSGIHPGYSTWRDAARIRREADRLRTILGEAVTHGRQHFLRMSLPETYRSLSAAGLRHDHTMGFAARPGYRAGTSEPFPWYDLARDTVTELTVHPFAVMDVTLRRYQGMDATAARAALLGMRDYCREEGLSFTTLWHNSSFAPLEGWEGWWEVYAGLFGE